MKDKEFVIAHVEDYHNVIVLLTSNVTGPKLGSHIICKISELLLEDDEHI